MSNIEGAALDLTVNTFPSDVAGMYAWAAKYGLSVQKLTDKTFRVYGEPSSAQALADAARAITHGDEFVDLLGLS